MISNGVRVNLCTYDQLPVKIGQVFVVDHEEIAVFRLTNGDIRAIENKSPHPKGGRLADGLVSGDFVYCPIHDWIISLVDGKVQAPDRGHVKTYQVEVNGDQVFLVV